MSHATTILATAYAVNPYKGSEDGTGWNFLVQISQDHQCLAITRRNNQDAIDRYRSETEDSTILSNLTFEYFDLPAWMYTWWKRGGRFSMLYHYLWHIGVVWFIWRRQFQFDIAHHLNFHSDWSPTFLWLLGRPTIWGPVGHHVKIPMQYLKFYGTKEVILDRLKWIVKQFFWLFDPFLKLAAWRVHNILAVNSSVAEVLSFSERKTMILPAIAATDPKMSRKSSEIFEVLSVGRFVPLKGFDLTIEAFARFYKANRSKNIRLTLVGRGPEEDRLVALAAQVGLPTSAINWINWIDQVALRTYYSGSNIFLFPSHEGAGMVVPEALSFGLPVICLDNYGPGESISNSCGVKVPQGSREETIQGLVEALQKCYDDDELLSEMALAARAHYEATFQWSAKRKVLKTIYEQCLSSHPSVMMNNTIHSTN